MPSVEQENKAYRFGDPRHIAIERGIGEFRATRPVLIRDTDICYLAMPVDGLDDIRLAAFVAACAPATPKLAITPRRARTLGIDAPGPVLLSLIGINRAHIQSLALDGKVDERPEWKPAGAAIQAALDLAKLGERLPALLVAQAKPAKVDVFDPPAIAIDAAAVAQFRSEAMNSLTIAGDANVPLEGGVQSRFVIFRNVIGGDAVAVVVGNPDFSLPVPVRLHSACLTGDVFGSRRCDCGDQLRIALKQLAIAGGEIILYLDQEGRGLGLANKMRAYRLQDTGFDTVDANTSLGFDDDERDYGVAGRMLDMLGCKRVQLLTNNPSKISGLQDAGIEISGRKPLLGAVNRDNRRYLTAKARRNGHSLDHLLDALGSPEGAADNAGAVRETTGTELVR